MPTSASQETLAVIDAEHLDRITFRDLAFRNEVLTLFVREARVLEQRLASAATAEDWRVAAHTLKGMSRGVGATRLAAISEQCEQLPSTASRKDALSQLSHHIAEAIGETERIVSCP